MDEKAFETGTDGKKSLRVFLINPATPDPWRTGQDYIEDRQAAAAADQRQKEAHIALLGQLRTQSRQMWIAFTAMLIAFGALVVQTLQFRERGERPAFHLAPGEKIGGIMGLTLGHKFYPLRATAGCKLLETWNDSDESSITYTYQLPRDRAKSFRINTVAVEVTPRTGLICGIWARTSTNEFATLQEANVTLNRIISELQEKHGPAVGNYVQRGTQRVAWHAFEHYSTIVNAKEQKQAVVSGAMVVIHCFDRALFELARAEREEINGKSDIFESF